MYLCGPRKHNCQPFCGPKGRFYCSDSVCSLRPAPFSYLRVRVRILGVLKIVCGWANKTWLLPYACCGLQFIDSAACVLSFYTPPLHYIKSAWKLALSMCIINASLHCCIVTVQQGWGVLTRFVDIYHLFTSIEKMHGMFQFHYFSLTW